MKLSMGRAWTIARREYLTTVRRKAFVLTLVLVPAYYALISILPTLLVGKSVEKRLASMQVVGVVDSSGALGGAPLQMRTESRAGQNPFAGRRGAEPETARVFTARVEFLPDQATGDARLRSGEIAALLVMPPDYLETGRFRRYTRESGLFGSTQDRTLRAWLARALVAGAVDSTRAERAAQPTRRLEDFTLDREERWVLKDDARELVDVFLPIGVALLLGMAIVIGGQYLLQGVSEEKESRILESLLCTVTPDDLMVGKLLGLGTAGMTLVTAWTLAGLAFGGPLAAIIGARLSPFLLTCGVLYFVFGYLFYASLMTAIGAIANNLREAQQIAYMFTFANFAPMIVWFSIVESPNAPIPVTLSMIPLTAAPTMLMRLGTGLEIPLWQVGLSLGILVASALIALRLGAKIFRTGLLLYGKTPNLPEILRWIRQA